MEDFNALAAALGAGILDVRGCLILSSDGLVLGAHPENAEVDARPARIKITAMGDPERGFLQFGTEVWCYVRRGPYAALAVTGTRVRPGLVIDQMEQVLLQAEESRSRRDGLRLDAATPPAPAQVATTKPRTPLHPDPRPVEEPVIVRAERVAAPSPSPAAAPSPAASPPPAPGGREAPPDAPEGEPADADRGERDPAEEVDRFSLAREFSRLLQDEPGPADG